jgi:RNA polymerase sigma-70 factor (ECF subfamily)
VTSEQGLIERAQSGDSEAFCQLARLYQKRIYWLALHYCHDSHDAEDLSQEVWLKAYRSLSSFRGESSFYTWLRQITINTFLNYQRTSMQRLQRATISTIDDGDALDDVASAEGFDLEEVVGNRILIEKVMRALGELTSQQRLIFLLKHREGMTYDEISRSLGCSIGTVKKALFRAVMKLREQLGVGSGSFRAEAAREGQI